LLIELVVGENFSTEPGGLFEEPPAMIPSVTNSVGQVDSAVAQQKNGNIFILLKSSHQNYINPSYHSHFQLLKTELV